MSTIGELGAFLARETAAATGKALTDVRALTAVVATPNGSSDAASTGE
jgi:hypothetical protein